MVTIVFIVPTKITRYSSPCFASFGTAQNYPRQKRYRGVDLAAGVWQNGEQDDWKCRYRKIGR
jgi:hypothetical protein